MKFGQIVEGISHMIFQMKLILLHLNRKEFFFKHLVNFSLVLAKLNRKFLLSEIGRNIFDTHFQK